MQALRAWAPAAQVIGNFLNDSTQRTQHCLRYDLRWVALGAIQATLKESSMISQVGQGRAI